ncbi:hypothetical protein GBAR_LOCUS12704 [Geodia barretti]|uniref:Uncharacterized protein n=1 Tax=Geodia barretti TaxID=519541 RepID=A0AA35WNZ8_GEOBA|nr:hypothetical protein GBAR_LOCUS12704 [Geodia barretti]
MPSDPASSCHVMDNRNRPQSWGKFSRLSVSSTNSGPVITFTSGDVCREHVKGLNEGAVLVQFFDFTPNSGEKAWKTDHSGNEYYVNLCGSIPEFTGTSMWIQTNSTDGFSHAIVNMECVDDSADVSRAETMKFVKVTTSTAGSERHTFYHFNIWTKKGCSFTDNGGDHSGSSGSSGSGGTSSTVVALLGTLVVLMVATIFLAFIFYKKERQDRFINLFKNKSSEPVKYEKLPMTLTEETSLLEEGSSGSEYGEGSGEEEGEGEGGKGGKRRPRDKDEELIIL